MSARDGIRHTFLVALGVSVVCSVMVAAAATVLKPAQERNKTLDMKRNVLAAARMLPARAGSDQIEGSFATLDARLVNLADGVFVDGDALGFDLRAARKDPNRSRVLDGAVDVAGIKRVPDLSVVYMLPATDGGIAQLVLPVWGYGLWSTMWGFLALEGDLNTVGGLGFYEHGETPGLGGEIDNPSWRAKWPGKRVFGDDGRPAISVTKRAINADDPDAVHKVDAISGATLTSDGVEHMLRFWLGPHGYGPLLAHLRSGEVAP